MADGAIRTPVPMRVANASIFLATIMFIVILIGVFLSFDIFLARIDRRESDAHAAAEYAKGAALLREGRASDAAEHFSAAVAIDRSDVNYTLALGEAMLQEGRVVEAEATLRGLLARAGNDGAVNLTMAHVMIREGHVEEAKAYFHRAVFGRWGADSLTRRTEARFELINLLVHRGARSELLAELLPFEEVSPDSVALRRRLGSLFILAGSPERAANMYREVLRRDPDDVDAYAGMGEAAFALGNFLTARADFSEASRRRPNDARIAARLAIADTVLALDPTARDVRSSDRLRRSRVLLSRTLAEITACGGPNSALADSARSLLAPVPARRGDTGDKAAAMMGVAVDLWATRRASCAPVARDDVLRLVLNRIAQ